MSQKQNDPWRNGIAKVESVALRLVTWLIIGLSLALIFAQQVTTGQGDPTRFYQVVGGRNAAGFMMGIPVTIGFFVQYWRLKAYHRGSLSGQMPDYIVTTLIMMLAIGVDFYVFICNPVFGWPIDPELPRFVVFGWLLVHAGQEGVEFWTDQYHQAQMRAQGEQDDAVVRSFSGSRHQNNHRERVVEIEREPVSPKDR